MNLKNVEIETLINDHYYLCTCKTTNRSKIGTIHKLVAGRNPRTFRYWKRVEYGWQYLGEC